MDCSICFHSFHSKQELSSHSGYWQVRNPRFSKEPTGTTATVNQSIIDYSAPSTTNATHEMGTEQYLDITAKRVENHPSSSVISTAIDDPDIFPVVNDLAGVTRTTRPTHVRLDSFPDGVPTKYADGSDLGNQAYNQSKPNVLPCSHEGCNKECKTVWEWRRHYGTHVKTEESCSACKKSFSRLSQVLNHRHPRDEGGDVLSSRRETISRDFDIILNKRRRVDQPSPPVRATGDYDNGPAAIDSTFPIQDIPSTSAGVEPGDDHSAYMTQDGRNKLPKQDIPYPRRFIAPVGAEMSNSLLPLQNGSVAPGIWGNQSDYIAPCIQNNWLQGTYHTEYENVPGERLDTFGEFAHNIVL